MGHPATGPISPEQMRELADAPYGKAAEVLRLHDPLFGKKEGDKIKWRVEVETEARMVATTIVEAISKEEAEAIVSKRDANSFDWDCYDANGFNVESVEPA